MTFNAILTLTIVTFVIVGIVALVVCDSYISTKSKAIIWSITAIICLAIWGVTIWYYKNTETGKRAFKTQKSNLTGGITREVKVYDVEGDVIATYRGRFDIEYDDDRILFDDEKGNRHIIYYPTGNIIVDEVGE
jgi:cell division protein FtsI/penicillin-binding protein 2